MLINKNGLQLYSISKRNGLVVDYDLIINTSAINNGRTIPPVSSGTETVTLTQAADVSHPQISNIAVTGVFLIGDIASFTYAGDEVDYEVQFGDTNNSIALGLLNAALAYQVANPGSALAIDLTVTQSTNNVILTSNVDNVSFVVTVLVTPATALPFDFQLRNYGQAIVSNINETLTGALNDVDSGAYEEIVFNAIAIDGITVKAGGLLDKSYSVRLDNIVLVEPLWKRPVATSPVVIYIIQDGLYQGIAKSYTIPYTIAQVWNYILNGSY